MTTAALTKRCNRLAGEVVKTIVTETINAGGRTTDILVVLESVVVGVCLTCIRLGGDDKVLDVVIERARARLAELRLGEIETRGKA